jgi:hypothetical protein
LVKTRQAYQCICLQLGARAKRLSLDWVRRGEREVMEMNRQLQETDATLSGSKRRFKLRLDKWQSIRECCGALSPVSSARAFGNTGGCLKLRLSPIAFGNQTISLTTCPTFRHCGKETHGFASLPRGRFAIYRVQSFKRSLALPCPYYGRSSAISIKTFLVWFVNRKFFYANATHAPSYYSLRVEGKPVNPSLATQRAFPLKINISFANNRDLQVKRAEFVIYFR